jgi:paraquat-inducible protein A
MEISHTSEDSGQTQEVTSLSHMACPDCDLIQTLPPLQIGEVANCIRCNATLFKNQKNSVDRSLAFAITGLILFIIANLFPLLSLKAMGLTQDGTLLSTSMSLFQADRPFLSIVILLTTFVFPATTLLGTIYILLQVKNNRINAYTAPLFRFLRSTDAWGMLEIFMLAVLVAVVKLGDLADVIYGISLYAFCLLIISLTLLSYSLNPHDVWNKLRQNKGCQL